jgi:hypothetical protein
MLNIRGSEQNIKLILSLNKRVFLKNSLSENDKLTMRFEKQISLHNQQRVKYIGGIGFPYLRKATRLFPFESKNDQRQ